MPLAEYWFYPQGFYNFDVDRTQMHRHTVGYAVFATPANAQANPTAINLYWDPSVAVWEILDPYS